MRFKSGELLGSKRKTKTMRRWGEGEEEEEREVPLLFVRGLRSTGSNNFIRDTFLPLLVYKIK